MINQQSTNPPKAAAPIIKSYAKEFLSQNKNMTVDGLKTYVLEKTGYNFTSGQYAGALKTLVDEPGYTTIRRGVYIYKPDNGAVTANVSNEPISLRDKINQILEQAQANLRPLAIVDLYDANEQVFSDVSKLKEIILSIENLKF